MRRKRVPVEKIMSEKKFFFMNLAALLIGGLLAGLILYLKHRYGR
jgi:hypothetical protein